MSNTAEIIQFRAPVVREELRVADTDNGFMRIANELTDSILLADLTARQLKIMLAIMRKTYGFNKPLDRITNTQIAEMTGIHHTHVCSAKRQLIERGFLVSNGTKVGINKHISMWDMKPIKQVSQNSETLAKSANKTLANSANTHSPKQLNTKDTIQKTLKTDPPKAPKGEFSEEILSQAKQALEYYNELTQGSCRSAEPFAVLLTETKSRSAYTLQDLQLVVRWVVMTWKRRDNTIAKPMNICRVNRFDGYLSDAEAWQKTCVDIDCQAVIEVYNDVTNGRMAPVELDRGREIAIRELVTHLATKTSAGFRAYFSAFLEDAREFYFGGPDGTGWHADFEYLMKPETLRKVREGTL
ncbi:MULTISPECIES: replication protein [unclassified Serratia (in: enterobacteria)]|uniref:replication protein n=1 Tax=unclassified Serratia (in: enterobacteria) TaxID=2647522 RepID=UPI000501B2DA|nr:MULTISPECIES: replication protein [unclassified Serratia (in: enterobacteria)]KFK93595.1 replication protein [Serratia sp. Ag2]KFK98535.1 replication protein [Serratia sp. Ag1]